MPIDIGKRSSGINTHWNDDMTLVLWIQWETLCVLMFFKRSITKTISNLIKTTVNWNKYKLFIKLSEFQHLSGRSKFVVFLYINIHCCPCARVILGFGNKAETFIVQWAPWQGISVNWWHTNNNHRITFWWWENSWDRIPTEIVVTEGATQYSETCL